MKNLYDVLRQKEAELAQVQKEIEALRITARLLAEETDTRAEIAGPSISQVTRLVSAEAETHDKAGLRAVSPTSPPLVRATTVFAKDATPSSDSTPRQFP